MNKLVMIYNLIQIEDTYIKIYIEKKTLDFAFIDT